MRKTRFTLWMLSPTALAMCGCTGVTINANSTSDSDSAAIGPAAENSAVDQSPPEESALTALARDMATYSSVSVASGTPISLQPNPTPDNVAFYIPPALVSSGSTTSNPPPPTDPNTGDPNTGAGPVYRPGYYHGTRNATVYEEILSVDPNLPHGPPFQHGDSVFITVQVADPSTVSAYTIPGYVFNSDEVVDVMAVGTSTTVFGSMPGLSTNPPGQFMLVATTTSLTQVPGSFSLTADFVLTGHAGSMQLSGAGTHTVTATWSAGVMQYHSYTDYHVGMSAGSAGLAPVMVDTRQTFTIDAELTE